MSLEFWSLFIRGETNEKILLIYTNTFELSCQISGFTVLWGKIQKMRGLINIFRGGNAFLSNMYEMKIPIEYNNFLFYTVENAYAASKTTHSGKQYRISQMNPYMAKNFGEKVFEENISPNPNWSDEYRIEVMVDLVRQKFVKNPDLLEKFLATGDAEIINGNYQHDNFWGECFCGNCPEEKRLPKEERNNLGKIHEKIRKEFRDQKEGN